MIRWHKSDWGTVVAHWLGVALVVFLTATGLKLLADEPDYRWLSGIAEYAPGGDPWYRHIVSGYAFAAVAVFYIAYIAKAGLSSRIVLDSARLKGLLHGGKPFWSSLNLIATWIFFFAALVCIITGFFLSAGFDAELLFWHVVGFWIVVAFPIVHVLLHLRIGGVGQIARIFRPTRLMRSPPAIALEEIIQRLLSERSGIAHTVSDEPRLAAKVRTSRWRHPATIGMIALILVLSASLGFDQLLGRPLVAAAIENGEAPVLDGDLAEAVWSNAEPIVFKAGHGGDFGGTGETTFEVRAVHDRRNIYFAVKWSDPTRSLQATPMRKEHGRWKIVGDPSNQTDGEYLAGDRLAMMAASPGRALIGGAIHLGRTPIEGGPQPASGRGLHYMKNNRGIVDVWQWSPAADAAAGFADDGYIGEPLPYDEAQVSGLKPYRGGFSQDRLPGVSEPNILTDNPTSEHVVPKRLPDHPSVGTSLAKRLKLDPTHSGSIDETDNWGMSESRSRPYSKSIDRSIPNGAVLPGVVVNDLTATGQSEVATAGKWAGGAWVVEIRRPLATEDTNDVAIRSGVLLWFAAFDQSPTRHSYHLRPLIMELD